jgi:hypothetical protein
MEQYEYIEEAVKGTEGIIELMDKLGKQGWKVVGVLPKLLHYNVIYQTNIYFMRTLPQDNGE